MPVPKGKAVQEVREGSARQGAGARSHLREISRPEKLRRAGAVQLPGSARRWRLANGKVVSRKAAFKSINDPLLTRKQGEKLDSLEGRQRTAYLRQLGYKNVREGPGGSG